MGFSGAPSIYKNVCSCWDLWMSAASFKLIAYGAHVFSGLYCRSIAKACPKDFQHWWLVPFWDGIRDWVAIRGAPPSVRTKCIRRCLTPRSMKQSVPWFIRKYFSGDAGISTIRLRNGKTLGVRNLFLKIKKIPINTTLNRFLNYMYYVYIKYVVDKSVLKNLLRFFIFWQIHIVLKKLLRVFISL